MLIVNPNAGPSTLYGPALQAILNHEGFETARRARNEILTQVARTRGATIEIPI